MTGPPAVSNGPGDGGGGRRSVKWGEAHLVQRKHQCSFDWDYEELSQEQQQHQEPSHSDGRPQLQ